MKYIFGLGLPRTCTNSLGSALHLIGINGECKCILNDFYNKREKDNNSTDYKYIIYNDAYQELDMLLCDDKIYNNKYILTIRNNNDWNKSIQNFDKKELVEELKTIKMDEYIDKINKIFKEKNCIHNLLIINIFEEEDELLWSKLYKFLNLDPEDDVIDSEFPKINLNQ
tara:strand:+ start:2738 stop:3244 length:507 start_codon:yes stop_codon:yes gene_type:complete